MSFIIDSNSPYFTEFSPQKYKDAVYMTADDDFFGTLLAIVYKTDVSSPKLSVILIGSHGTSGFLNMTLDRTSRYFAACRGLAPTHYNSPIRRALAIACLRTYTTTDKPLTAKLPGYFDAACAGSLGSRFRLLCGKFPKSIGERVVNSGLICAKQVSSSVVDVIYEDSDDTIDQNDELIYLLGRQLDYLLDPLTLYCPEQTDKLYEPLTSPGAGLKIKNSITVTSTGSDNNENDVWALGSLDDESQEVQDTCEELYLLESHMRSSLLDLLQTVVIPLRVLVLQDQFPGLNVSKLNAIFPPTIDELYRMHCILYDALKAALPFGAFEIIRACGSTMSYFYRACTRHLAATKHFETFVLELLDEFPELEDAAGVDIRANLVNITNVVYEAGQLKRFEPLLNKLLSDKAEEWTPRENIVVEELCSISSKTIRAVSTADTIENGIFNVIDKLFVNWPNTVLTDLESRRIITIFEAHDILETSDDASQGDLIFIIFSDVMIVCRPTERIHKSSLSGLHMPQICDVLMHSMLNNAPIDDSVPPLEVIAWSHLMDAHFASFEENLFVFSKSLIGSYELITSGFTVRDIVALLSKAKIVSKSEPFHLFEISDDSADSHLESEALIDVPTTNSKLQLLSAVQEVKSYLSEYNKSKVAVFLTTKMSETLLHQHNLYAAICLNFDDDDNVIIDVLTKKQYTMKTVVSKEELRNAVLNECSYLLTLLLSSQNDEVLSLIVKSNKQIASGLVQWSSRPPAENVITSKRGSTNTDDADQTQFNNWFHKLRQRRDHASLSSESLNSGEDNRSLAFSYRSDRSNNDLQIGAFLNSSSSSIYNDHAGYVFPRLDHSDSVQRRSSVMSSNTQIDENKRGSFYSAVEQIADIPESGDDKEVENTEDFAYLASLVDANKNVSRSNSMSTVRSKSPGLRERSLVRLGQYVVDGSSLGFSRSRSVDSITSGISTSSGGMKGSRSNSNFGSFRSLKSQRFLSARIDEPLLEVDEEELQEGDAKIAQNWLAWTTKRTSMIANQDNEEAAEGPGAPDIPKTDDVDDSDATATNESPDAPKRSESQTTFRKMVMSSSLHTLQLASFVIQLDQKAATSENNEISEELLRIKQDVTAIFKVNDLNIEHELAIRKRICYFFYLLTAYDYHKLASGLIEVEWTRRQRVSETFPEIIEGIRDLDIQNS